MSFRKQVAFVGAILLFFQVVPLSLIHTYAETEDSIDPQLVDTFRSHQPEYLQLNQPMDPSEQKTEVVQEFSFVDKTFRTTVGQPVIVQFASRIEADEVLVRIPKEGQISEEHFSSGESITHSHGEYWLVKTNQKQTSFELPVSFDTAGQYFITVDHDADHFYLEVAEEDSTVPTIQEAEMSGEEKIQVKEEGQPKTMSEFPPATQPVTTAEQNLVISEELIAAENERILEETLDPFNRSRSIVRNWSQFRSAWNSSRTTQIDIIESIRFSVSLIGGDSLNTRTTSVGISGSNHELNFQRTNNNLEISGRDTTLEINHLTLAGGIESMSTIKHTGNGHITISNVRADRSPGTVVEGQNISLYSSFWLDTISPNPPIKVVRNGTLTISNVTSSRGMSWIASNSGVANNNTKPISSTAGTRIIVNVNQLTMGTARFQPRSSWHRVNATLSGVNGSQVVSSNSNPDDFAVRYTQLFNEAWYSSLIFNGSGSEFEPPIQTGTVTTEYVDSEGNELAQSESITGNVGTRYTTQPKDIDGWTLIEVPSNASGLFTQEPITVRYVYQQKKWSLSLQANPTLGGSPSSDDETLSEKETTTIRANPNDEYRFVKWEIVSGTNAKIANETAENTTFTMGNSAVSVRAIYEKELTNVNPLDPLDPDKEIDPENPPVLPEDQGLLSIDFVSQFNFGPQRISVSGQTYYAQPQRLLNEDGTVNEAEERPNFVQISDRRPEDERNGWQLSVTQNGQFSNQNGHELIGSEIQLFNQELVTAQGGTMPELQEKPVQRILPNTKKVLLQADKESGTGTWIYRFGDQNTADKSIGLYVPKGTNPEATSYSTKLTWELSSVPEN